MIRVAFVIEGESFLGSVNYFRNLFSAIALLPERKLHPLLLVGKQMPDKTLANFRQVEIVRSSLLDERTLAARVRRKVKRLSGGNDLLFKLLLWRHRVDVLSHAFPLPGSRVKTIGWIPDFQHVRLPEFFSPEERALRDAEFNNIARHCDRVVLSSEAAQRDLADFAPAAAGKSRVLRFVPEVDSAARVMPLADLEAKYGFHGHFFYMPNQFWIHKNHRIVVDALEVLKSRGIRPTVLMTGSTKDYRHPDHYAGLMSHVERNGLADSFKVLGLVPYADLLSLMHHSLAVINPSLFEGWSSSVEEAKALGKTVLLSNLAVHLEQNPAKGIFFDPANADDLAAKIAAVMERGQHESCGSDLALSETYKADRMRFAARYEDIVVELVGQRA